MTKRLLIALMAMFTVVSGFALEQGEYVYTPSGRYVLSGGNMNPNNAFLDMTGWTVVGEGKTFTDLFNTIGNGLSEGMNSVQSTGAVTDEGMYYKFEPSDPTGVYVVSMKLKGAALDNIQYRIPGDGNKRHDNLVRVAGNSAQVYGDPTDEVVANSSFELTDQWQTYTCAIEGDGTPRTWFISFTTMAGTIEIADLQIAPAVKIADLRLRDNMLEKLYAYKRSYAWSESLLKESGFDEIVAALEAIGNESLPGDLDEQLGAAQEMLGEFVKANMDDYLSANTANYLGIKTTSGNDQKLNGIGDWLGLPGGRSFWSSGAYPDFGHYAGNTSWCFGSTESPMGVYMQKTLDPGSYVFTIEGNAAVREDATSSSWTINEGWNVAFAEAYIAKVVDGVVTDTIVKVTKDLEAVKFTQFVLNAKVEEAGTYEIALKGYCKDAYKALKNGSVMYVANASLVGKNENKYNQRELAYETNVRTQITTGRDNLTTAAGYLADASYLWGKAALKACTDTIETKIVGYEALSQDDIIATYDEDVYENTTNNENGLLQYTVYQEATKWIIAANRDFLAANETLNSIETAINDAQNVLAMRIYSAATGKDALAAAIKKTQEFQAAMKAADYSEENAAAIADAIAELNDAVEEFKTTVPADAAVTLVDIDFEKPAVLNEETNLYSISGALGTMEFSWFSPDGTGNQPYEKGFWSNGEQLWSGYVRIGNGTGTVAFDPTVGGTMGTNIVKVSCDFYLQGLSGRNVGFFIKDAEDLNICGLYRNYYNGTDDTNTFGVDLGKYVWAKSGSSYDNASPADADAETLTANPLQKTHFEVILDYGEKSMYCTVSSPNGTTASQKQVLSTVPAKFVLQSNYNNQNRRPWFDNLKIERITAGECEPFDPTNVSNVTVAPKAAAVKTLVNGAVVITDANGVQYNAAGAQK